MVWTCFSLADWRVITKYVSLQKIQTLAVNPDTEANIPLATAVIAKKTT